MTLSLTNVLETLPTDGWPDDPLPLVVEMPPAQPFPMDALPTVMADYGHVIQRCTQAPDALVGNSLLAAASLAVQPYVNVQLPHGAIVPATRPENANCTKPCSEDARPRIVGNRSSNSNVRLGIATLLPSVNTAIGNTCHGTAGATNAATTSSIPAPANMHA